MSTLLFIGGLGGWEVLLIVAIVLILFGAKKIPELARGLGTGIKEFKNATTEIKSEMDKEDDIKSAQPSPAPEPKPTTTAAAKPPTTATTTPVEGATEVSAEEARIEEEEEKKSKDIAS